MAFATGMKSRASTRFWKRYMQLPAPIQRLARRNYKLWTEDPQHPSLGFHELRGGKGRFSVRVGDHYRALGERTPEGIEWVWIGSHEEYNRLLRR